MSTSREFASFEEFYRKDDSEKNKEDREKKHWLNAANLLIQQTAEDVAKSAGLTKSKESPSKSLSGAESILEHSATDKTNLAVPKASPIVPVPIPSAMMPNLPPGLNPAALAALSATGALPFGIPPFNVGMPPFFNPALMEHMSKIYGGAMMPPPGMGGLMAPPGQGLSAAGLTGTSFLQPAAMVPEADGTLDTNGDGGPKGLLASTASSLDDDFDDLTDFDVSTPP